MRKEIIEYIADPKIEYFECDIGTKGDEYLIFNTLEMLH